MRILHLTHQIPWFRDHFNFICEQLGHTGETQEVSNYALTAQLADGLWEKHKDYYNQFDAIHVSHLAQLARIFLQNGWEKPLYIWLCFRFDYFSPVDTVDREAYRQLIKEARLKPNVKFFAASEHDRLHIQRVLGDFPVEIVQPLVYVNSSSKVLIPCGERDFYIINKHNETICMDLKKTLDELNVPNYKHEWHLGPPDLRNIKGIIHIPYTFLTRGFYENLAEENVFFVPSLEFFESLRCNRLLKFFWDVEGPADVPLSEWYKQENQKLFVYFSSFEELARIASSPNLDSLILEKKERIRQFNLRHNEKNIIKWRGIFS